MSKAHKLLEVSPAKAARDAARMHAFLARKHAEVGHQDNHHQHNQVQQPSIPAMTPQRLHHEVTTPSAPTTTSTYTNKPPLGVGKFRVEKIVDEPVVEEPRYVETEQDRDTRVAQIKAQMKAGTYRLPHEVDKWKRGGGASIFGRLKEGRFITMTKSQYILEVSDKKKARDAERMAAFMAKKAQQQKNAEAFKKDQEMHRAGGPVRKAPDASQFLTPPRMAGYHIDPQTGQIVKKDADSGAEIHRPATKSMDRQPSATHVEPADIFKRAEVYRSQTHEPLKFRDMSPKEGHQLPWNDPRRQHHNDTGMIDPGRRGVPNWREMSTGKMPDAFSHPNAHTPPPADHPSHGDVKVTRVEQGVSGKPGFQKGMSYQERFPYSNRNLFGSRRATPQDKEQEQGPAPGSTPRPTWKPRNESRIPRSQAIKSLFGGQTEE